MQRRHWMSGWGVMMWAVVFLLLMGVRAYGQTGGVIDAKVVSLGLGGVAGDGGAYRPGAWVPVRVRLENRSGRTLTGRLGVQQPDLDGDKALSVGGKFVLSPSADARDVWLYYWPRPDDVLAPVQQVLIMDEAGEQVVQTVPVKGAARIDRGEEHSPRWVVVLGPSPAGLEYFIQSYGGTEGVRYSLLPTAGDLPDNVLGLDGVDVVVWEADAVKPSDLAPDFQMKALLEWVRSGGHLIITAGRQGEELQKSGALHEALPMDITGVRQVAEKDFAAVTGAKEAAKKAGVISQLTGELKPGNGAKVVSGGAAGVFADHPLAVTGLYGRGAVTMLTVDASAAAVTENLVNDGAMLFWDQVAGWQPGSVMTKAEHAAAAEANANSGWNDSPQSVALGSATPGRVDVTEVTQVRLLVAVLFLLVYWLAAGPIGHVILKAYGVVHWSWWAFGATVIVAAGIAAGVVAVLHLTNYDLRHKTVVIGTVNGREVTALGFYGVFAPASGTLTVEEPAAPVGASGLDYLVPLCEPTDEGVRPFADPQSYTLWDDKPWSPAPVFRNTLKKMQGKWTGQMGGIEGKAEWNGSVVSRSPLRGELTNTSGYDLENVRFVLYRRMEGGSGDAYVHGLDVTGKGVGTVWKAGSKITLETMVKPEGRGPAASLSSELTQIAARHASGGGLMGAPRFGSPALPSESAAPRDEDLLDVLLDARQPEGFKGTAPRYEPLRGLARGMDVTKLLHAAGCVIVAQAGDIGQKRYVQSPVPMSVNGRVVTGEGDVLFVWVLPLPEAGDVPLVPGGVGGRGPE